MAPSHHPMNRALIFFFLYVIAAGCEMPGTPAGFAEPATQSKPHAESSELQKRIRDAIEQTQKTYDDLHSFKKRIAAHATVQARSIACSANRICRTRSTCKSPPLEQLAEENDLLSYATKELPFWRGSRSSLPVVFLYMDFPEPFRQQFNYVLDAQKLLDPGAPDFEGDYRLSRRICDLHYLKPIPASETAKLIETEAFAEEIALSLRRLTLYSAKFSEVEAEGSRILGLQSTLAKLRKDLEFDAVDPTRANDTLISYRRQLNEVTRTIEEAENEVTVSQTVNAEEIGSVLGLFD